MTGQNWFVSNDGQCNLLKTIPFRDNQTDPYRLYRFLTDLEDILDKISDDYLRLQAICPLVRQLLKSSSWLQMPFLEPDPQTGWAVQTLYDEPFFPLTVQLVAWSPGATSPIHNHGSWGVVALLDGEEKNTFWQRSPTSKFPDRIQKVNDKILITGDILCLMPDSIHQVESTSSNPTISLNLYGETNQDRFEFDSIQYTAHTF